MTSTNSSKNQGDKELKERRLIDMWRYIKTEELMHFGIKGMKWGVRRKERREHLKGAARNSADIERAKSLVEYGKRIEKRRRERLPSNKLTKEQNLKRNQEFARERAEDLATLRYYENIKKERYSELSDQDLAKGERYLNREIAKSVPRAQRRYERAAKRYYKRNRKYQNEDGTLTPAGRKKYGRSNE